MNDNFRIIAIRASQIPDDIGKENRDKALRIQKKIGENLL